MFAGEIAYCVTQQMLLIVALVPKNFVTSLAEKLQILLFFLYLLQ